MYEDAESNINFCCLARIDNDVVLSDVNRVDDHYRKRTHSPQSKRGEQNNFNFNFISNPFSSRPLSSNLASSFEPSNLHTMAFARRLAILPGGLGMNDNTDNAAVLYRSVPSLTTAQAA
jgi:hypothetical protein